MIIDGVDNNIQPFSLEQRTSDDEFAGQKIFEGILLASTPGVGVGGRHGESGWSQQGNPSNWGKTWSPNSPYSTHPGGNHRLPNSNPSSNEGHIPYTLPQMPKVPSGYHITPLSGTPSDYSGSSGTPGDYSGSDNQHSGGYWSLGTLDSNAWFLNNLLNLGEAYANTSHGGFTVRLNSYDNSTTIQFTGPGYAVSDEQPYMDLDALINELHLGDYRGSGLPEDLAGLHEEINSYLVNGELSKGTAAQPDWKEIEDPDEAWRRFGEQYPDLADLVEQAARYDDVRREDVMNLMKRGYVLSEALALLRDGRFDIGNIPPDIINRLSIAGGFDEPDENGRRRIAEVVGGQMVTQDVIDLAFNLDVDPMALAGELSVGRAYAAVMEHRREHELNPTETSQTAYQRALNKLQQALHTANAGLANSPLPDIESTLSQFYVEGESSIQRNYFYKPVSEQLAAQPFLINGQMPTEAQLIQASGALDRSTNLDISITNIGISMSWRHPFYSDIGMLAGDREIVAEIVYERAALRADPSQRHLALRIGLLPSPEEGGLETVPLAVFHQQLTGAQALGISTILARIDISELEQHNLLSLVQMGFDAPLGEALLPRVQASLGNVQTLRDLLATEQGQTMLSEPIGSPNGLPIRDLRFDATQGSESMSLYQQYLQGLESSSNTP